MEKYGPEGTKVNAIGTGPYELVKWVPMDKIEIKRFDGYWGDKANVEKIRFVSFGDAVAAEKALSAGQIDLMKPAPESLQKLRKNKEIKIVQFSGGGFSWIGFLSSSW